VEVNGEPSTPTYVTILNYLNIYQYTTNNYLPPPLPTPGNDVENVASGSEDIHSPDPEENT
jgi:hypothetical protein